MGKKDLIHGRDINFVNDNVNFGLVQRPPIWVFGGQDDHDPI